MKSTVVTNALLAIIAVLLFLNLLAKGPVPGAEADTFKLDDCITSKAGDRPAGYVHVVSH
ncbi:MAG TPA: hypothetical protein P5521_00585 [Candidatus Omnitrophota bacterium]|nr:hypothetical protein [Candidatus Omnitrophota bacterium]HRZ66608.1 hypothetical protein [Candidatus Omnitrophota bacterium]